jgi:hypothetical protein
MHYKEAIISAGIVIIVLLIILYVYYYMPTWVAFSVTLNDNLGIKSTDISKLRFKDCVFTIVDGTHTYTANVTKNLNIHARYYMGKPSLSSAITTFNLAGPLNPFSFPIKDYNDSNASKSPNGTAWCTNITTPSKSPGGAVPDGTACPAALPTTYTPTNSVQGLTAKTSYAVTPPSLNSKTTPAGQGLLPCTVGVGSTQVPTTFVCINKQFVANWDVPAYQPCVSTLKVTLSGYYKQF